MKRILFSLLIFNSIFLFFADEIELDVKKKTDYSVEGFIKRYHVEEKQHLYVCFTDIRESQVKYLCEKSGYKTFKSFKTKVIVLRKIRCNFNLLPHKRCCRL